MPEVTHPQSPLGSLIATRDQIVSEQFLTLTVPRWHNPELKLRFKPADHDDMHKANRKMEKAPAEQLAYVEVQEAAATLAKCCVGLYAVLEDGRTVAIEAADTWVPVDPDKLTKEPPFNDAVAATLGAPDHSARAILRKLYITDADLLLASTALGEWSGYKKQEADASTLGK